jgi:hypothetical protein
MYVMLKLSVGITRTSSGAVVKAAAMGEVGVPVGQRGSAATACARTQELAGCQCFHSWCLARLWPGR